VLEQKWLPSNIGHQNCFAAIDAMDDTPAYCVGADAMCDDFYPKASSRSSPIPGKFLQPPASSGRRMAGYVL